MVSGAAVLLVPAAVKEPPAISSPFEATTSASTSPPVKSIVVPELNRDHADDPEFHRAIRASVVLPDPVNDPPAIRSPLYTVSAFTVLFNPIPNATHVEPFQ